jgi:hypothetical protein
MALNNADKKLIDEVAENLRLRFKDQARWDGVTQEDFGSGELNVQSTNASRPVVLPKDELRENSGRRVARGAYLDEFAAALSQKPGIVARADHDKGAVYAQAVADAHEEAAPMNIKQLTADAQRAKTRFAEDEE